MYSCRKHRFDILGGTGGPEALKLISPGTPPPGLLIYTPDARQLRTSAAPRRIASRHLMATLMYYCAPDGSNQVRLVLSEDSLRQDADLHDEQARPWMSMNVRVQF